MGIPCLVLFLEALSVNFLLSPRMKKKYMYTVHTVKPVYKGHARETKHSHYTKVVLFSCNFVLFYPTKAYGIVAFNYRVVFH